MDTVAHRRFVPPVPTPPPAPLPLREFLRAIRDNALTVWPERAYHDEVTVRQFLGRKNVRTDEPTERVDTKILETLIELDPGQQLPSGLRVDTFIDTAN